MLYKMRIHSPLGDLCAESDGENLTALWSMAGKYDPAPEADRSGEELPVLRETRRWLELYFAGKQPDFMPPMRPGGTVFRELVWQILREIPYGKATSYGAVAKEAAKRLGKERMSAQAVGGAVGHNPILILIPCHRVLGADGSLTGFSSGLDKKKYLLELEGIAWREIPDATA